VFDVRFDVNKDVVNRLLVDEAESSPEEDAGRRWMQSKRMRILMMSWLQKMWNKSQLRIVVLNVFYLILILSLY